MCITILKTMMYRALLVMDLLPSFYINNVKNAFIHFYTQEFGLIYFQPIIFIVIFGSLIYLIYTVFKKKRAYWGIVFFIYMAGVCNFPYLDLTASSYGYRYLMNLAP